jgi:hypothetical protein
MVHALGLAVAWRKKVYWIFNYGVLVHGRVSDKTAETLKVSIARYGESGRFHAEPCR